MISTWEAFFVGFFSSCLTFFAMMISEKLAKFDDPCATFAVHGIPGVWVCFIYIYILIKFRNLIILVFIIYF